MDERYLPAAPSIVIEMKSNFAAQLASKVQQGKRT